MVSTHDFSVGDGNFILLCSIGGKVLYSSPELDRLMGKSMLNQHFYDFLSSEEIAKLMESLQETRVRMQCSIDKQTFFLVAEKVDAGIRIELFPLDPMADALMEPVSGQFFCREMGVYLSAILPAAQRLMQKVPEALQPEVAVILRNSFCHMRLQRNLGDLLDLQKGTAKLYLTKESVGALLEELVRETSAYCEMMGIRIQCVLPETTVFCILDKQRVRRMLYQLISNSIKAQSGGGQITLSLKEREKEISISVSDLGCGIPPQAMDQVFRKYKVSDPASGDSLGGMGLGLPLARQIAQLHGGRLMIVSNEGSGTAVSVTLPKTAWGEAMPLGMPAPVYTGGFDPAKMELSTVLKSEFYFAK